jgi:hypothetical protein
VLLRASPDSEKLIRAWAFGFVGGKLLMVFGVPDGIRTRVTAVKGRCPRPLDDGDALCRSLEDTLDLYAGSSEWSASSNMGAACETVPAPSVMMREFG